jgi:VWFA-related protein
MRTRAFCLASLLLPLLAAAQQKPQIPAIGETIEVSLVNLDVFVTDKTGKRVHGLTKDDFEILENGARQPITNFAEYAGEVAPAQPTVPQAAPSVTAVPRQKRTIVVFVERFSLPNYRTDPFFDSVKKLLHDAIRPGDRAMVVTWNRGVLLTQQEFTDSLPALDHALDTVAKLSSRPMQDLRSDMRWSIEFARSFDDQAAAAGLSSNGNGIADMEMDAYAQLERMSQLQMVRTLNAVIRVIAADEGKKIMLLVTHRLSREAGAETYHGNMRNTDGGIPLEKRAAMDMSTYIKSVDDTANANGVTMYPMFPEGLETTVTDSSESATVRNVDYQRLNNEMHALREIAEETGGLTASGTDAAKLLPRVGEDLDSYYSLAYRVRNTGADKARKIVVKTKDPSLVVRSRREFMEKSDVTRMEDRVIAALFGNPPSPGFPLHVDVGRPRARGREFTLPLTIHVPIGALTQLPDAGKYAGAFSVYFAWGGRLGGLSDTSHQTRNYTIPASEYEKARSEGHLTYQVELAVDRKTERLAFGVFDEISKEFALRLMNLRR